MNNKTKFNYLLVTTIVLGGFWQYFSNNNNPNFFLFGQISLYLAVPIWIYACVNYVVDRGYHWSIGVFIGLLTFLKGIGMIVLLILPNKNENKSF